MKNIAIQNFMTSTPQTIGPKIGLMVAIEKMKELGIRHLPVLEHGKLVGIITDRDIQYSQRFGDQDELTVEDVMTQDPFAAEPQTELRVVVDEMVRHKYGAVVVQDSNGQVKGIFTAIDGLKLLLEDIE